MTNRDYLTDEELMKLIDDVENDGMISAPVHLKENVISEIRRQRQHAKTVNLIAYRAKVVIGMAAAVGVFCIMPFKMPTPSERAIRTIEYREDRFQDMTERKASKEKRAEFVEKIIEKIDFIGRIE